MAKNGFDALYSEFYEEVKRDGKTVFTPRKQDHTFVHGKVYRRQYLIDNGIVWHPHLRRHQDSCFNVLALKLAKNPVYLPMPFYLWKWRDDSICRCDPLHIPKTFCDYIDSAEQLVLDFLSHGYLDDAVQYANALVYTTYFALNQSFFDGADLYREAAEKRFCAFYERHMALIESIDHKKRKEVIECTRAKAESEGLLLVRFTFADWINHINNMKVGDNHCKAHT